MAIIFALVFTGAVGAAEWTTDRIYNDLSKLEMSSSLHVYSSDSITTRLDRLELLAFGEYQSGTIESRLEKLLATAGFAPQGRRRATKPHSKTAVVSHKAAISPAAAANPENPKPEHKRPLKKRPVTHKPLQQLHATELRLKPRQN